MWQTKSFWRAFFFLGEKLAQQTKSTPWHFFTRQKYFPPLKLQSSNLQCEEKVRRSEKKNIQPISQDGLPMNFLFFRTHTSNIMLDFPLISLLCSTCSCILVGHVCLSFQQNAIWQEKSPLMTINDRFGVFIRTEIVGPVVSVLMSVHLKSTLIRSKNNIQRELLNLFCIFYVAMVYGLSHKIQHTLHTKWSEWQERYRANCSSCGESCVYVCCVCVYGA